MNGTIPRSGKAYEIFVTEYLKHIDYIGAALKADSLDSEEQQKLSRLFHTIKGGAGFFGFTTVHKTAGVLEKILKNPDLKYAEEKAEIASLFNELVTGGQEVKI